MKQTPFARVNMICVTCISCDARKIRNGQLAINSRRAAETASLMGNGLWEDSKRTFKWANPRLASSFAK